MLHTLSISAFSNITGNEAEVDLYNVR